MTIDLVQIGNGSFVVSLTKDRMDYLRERIGLRKCLGVICLFIEMNLLGGTIFGFPAIFEVLSKEKIYQNLDSIKQYQVSSNELSDNFLSLSLVY